MSVLIGRLIKYSDVNSTTDPDVRVKFQNDPLLDKGSSKFITNLSKLNNVRQLESRSQVTTSNRSSTRVKECCTWRDIPFYVVFYIEGSLTCLFSCSLLLLSSVSQKQWVKTLTVG